MGLARLSSERDRRRNTEPPSGPATSPRAIRSALLPQDAEAFDRDYRQALTAAAETLSLDELHTTLEHRRRIARMTQADPSAHRRMLAEAEQTLRTGQLPPGTIPADQVRAIIRARLGR